MNVSAANDSKTRPAIWSHDRDHFYKYVTASTAKETLRSARLRWSSVGLFNDPFDLGFDLHVEYDRDRVIQAVNENMWTSYAGLREFNPQNELGHVHACLRDNLPGMSREEFEAEMAGSVEESLVAGDNSLPDVRAKIRNSLRDVKLLCLSAIHDNLLMWSHYSGSHSGVVLRLACVPARDSIWGVAAPVRYEKSMPRMLSENELIRFLSGELTLTPERVVDLSILTKAIDWEYEQEWRIPLHFTDPDADFADLGFHPSELTALFLGCRITEQDRREIGDIAERCYPHAELWQGEKSEREFKIDFTRVR
ncbi:MAG TPA: DUF2971 domain-containing protein [Rhizomicrobium sp.]|jgi:hypothetical protein